jgi:hypothetical protein
MKIKETLMKIGLVILVTIFLSVSCAKNGSFKSNCQSLEEGILNDDESAIKSEMSILTKDLKPHPTTDDEWGHLNNFKLLIERLNQCKEINAALLGYCGIDTYPPQSEILITTYSNGQQIQKIFDIVTSKDTVLVYSGMHDTRNKK